MAALISMVCVALSPFASTVSESSKMTDRWCNTRQHVIKTARSLLVSDDCTYGIKELEKDKRADEVERLLEGEAYHFRKKQNSVRDLPA
jgi:hypothetical protein